MTTLYTNQLSGDSPGQALTIANSNDDGSDSLAFVNPTGGTWLYTSTGVARTMDTTASYIRGDHVAGDEVRGGVLFKFTISGAPASNILLANVRSTGDQLLCAPVLTTAKRFRAAHNTSATQITSADSNIMADGNYWIQCIATVDTATTGRVLIKVWDSSLTVVYTYDSTAILAMPAVNPGMFRFGTWTSTSAGANYPSMKFDDYVRWGAITSGDIPFVSDNTAPIANAGSDQTNIEPWTTVSHTGSVIDNETFVGGTVAWDVNSTTPTTTITLNTPTALTTTYTAPASLAGVSATLGFTATDADAAVSAEDTVTDTILYATERSVTPSGQVPMRIQHVE